MRTIRIERGGRILIDGELADISNLENKSEFFSSIFTLDVELEEGQVSEGVTGFVVLKSGGDIIGVGRLSADKKMISNYMPKERRVKN